MTSWHGFTHDGQNYIVLGFSRFKDNFLCVNLGDLSPGDREELDVVLGKPVIATIPYLFQYLPCLVHSTGVDWWSYLMPNAFDAEWWRIEDMLHPALRAWFARDRDHWQQIMQTEQTKQSVNDVLYSPVYNFGG